MDKRNLNYIAIFFVLLIAVLIFASQLNTRPSGPDSLAGFEDVTVEEAKKMIEEDVFVLDVRTPGEFNSSHIEGATLIPVTNSAGSNLSPDQLLEARINEVPKNRKILVYCRTGRRSAAASKILVAAGYTQVYNMQDGITAWTGAGYPVVS